jgi:hypothetical protein
MIWILFIIERLAIVFFILLFLSDKTLSHVHTAFEVITPLWTPLTVFVAAIGWSEQAKQNGKEARETAKKQAEFAQTAVEYEQELRNNAHRGYLRMRIIRCWGMVYEGTGGVKPCNLEKIGELNGIAEEAFWKQATFVAFSYEEQGKLQEVFDAVRVNVFLLQSAFEEYESRSKIVNEFLQEVGRNFPVSIKYFERTLSAFEDIFTDVFPETIILNKIKARLSDPRFLT